MKTATLISVLLLAIFSVQASDIMYTINTFENANVADMDSLKLVNKRNNEA